MYDSRSVHCFYVSLKYSQRCTSHVVQLIFQNFNIYLCFSCGVGPVGVWIWIWGRERRRIVLNQRSGHLEASSVLSRGAMDLPLNNGF